VYEMLANSQREFCLTRRLSTAQHPALLLNVTPAQLPRSAARRSPAAARPSRVILFASLGALLLAFGAPSAFADDHNPIGVTGAFEGVITTGCAYNVLNHNARRQIDDIIVPGSIGKYPLKMTRYYNSRGSGFGLMGPGWGHEYGWAGSSPSGSIQYPNGDEQDGTCFQPLAVSESWQTLADFRLADGGRVHFDSSNGYFQARTISDPYGQTTTLAYNNSGFLSRVTEPGGRYLQFTYATYNGAQVLHGVDAYDGQGHQIDSVVYHYTSEPTGGSIVPTAVCLTSVDYSDGQHAIYSYTTDNSPDNPTPPCPCPQKLLPVLQTCQDVRYKGAMRQICYEYQANGPHGAIIAERYSLNGSTNGPRVSRIDPPAPSPLITQVNFDTAYTEYRGDGPTRTFNYTPLHLSRNTHEDICPISSSPPQQFLQSYTDFRGQTTYLNYDANWYVNSVQDANLHTTTYTRGPPPSAYPGPKGIGQILTVTHPSGSHIDYTYYDEGAGSISGHYVQTISNERQKVTTYTRDGNYRVTRIDYPADANTLASYEEFLQYNNFGQFTVHHLKNLAYERFVYDGRGLLTDKYNPKSGAIPGGNDPHTHYDYYTSGPWTDRVQKMTLPANGCGNVASETYEYDVSPNNTSRGLVTKVTHADGTYQSFFYDAYGNKLWEENELRKRTTYSYDDYNRVLTVKNPLNKTTTYDYAPTQGNTTQAQQHTTSSAWWVTTPANIVTNNVYDQNWRKTSTSVTSITPNLTTSFVYDNVGNLTDITDPRGKKTHHVYDNRNRKTSTTEAYTTALAETTVWHYDPASNMNQIDRPDGKSETKGYDALNRMIWHSEQRQVPGASPAPTPITLTTHIAYKPSGTIDHVTDERGKVTSFQYNASDEKITMTYPGGTQSQSWVYDNAHNLLNRTTVHGGSEIQRFCYDNRNRKTSMTWDNGADSANYTYYDDNRLHIAVNPNSTVTRNYDDAGHLTLDSQNVPGPGTVNVNYPAYDNDGRLTQMNVGGASYDYTYSYDAAGRFEKIKLTSNGSVIFQYYYDAGSNETDRYANLPNNVQIQQHYNRDSLNRMSSRLVKNNGTTFSTEAYTYDHMNRITEVNRGGLADSLVFYWDGELRSASYGGGPHMPFTEGQDPDLDTTDNIDPNAGYQPPDSEGPEPTPPPDDYSDPKVGGLIPADLPGIRSLGYYLDRAGNRQEVTDTANPTATYYGINNLNQYSSVSGSTISNGNEHEVYSFQGLYDTIPVTYTYINDEHLTQARDSSHTYNLLYDALGRCVKRDLNGTTTYYIYDGEKPILDYSTSGSIVGRNVYGKNIDEILMRTNPGMNNGDPIYYAQDHEGSVTHLINGCTSPSNQTGNVLEKYAYDAFGVPTFMDGNGNNLNPNATAYNNRFLFTGREYAATYRSTYVSTFSFYEYRARAYNPNLGRFMSEDPKGFDAGDYNLFRYCHNDPIDMTDPMGLADIPNMPYHLTPELLAYFQGQAIANQIAHLQAQVHAMEYPGHGAIGIGMANFQIGQLQQALSGLSRALGFTRAASGPPASVTRSRMGAYSSEQDVTDPNTGKVTHWVHMWWKYELRDKSQPANPVAAGIPVHETISYSNPIDFNPPGTVTHDFRTLPGGYVTDKWDLPFTSMRGQVMTTQQLTVPTGTATFNTLVRANGGIMLTGGDTATFQ
jgi:RHS repeat-associated protein